MEVTCTECSLSARCPRCKHRGRYGPPMLPPDAGVHAHCRSRTLPRPRKDGQAQRGNEGMRVRGAGGLFAQPRTDSPHRGFDHARRILELGRRRSRRLHEPAKIAHARSLQSSLSSCNHRRVNPPASCNVRSGFVQSSKIQPARLVQCSKRLGSGNGARTSQSPGIPPNRHDRLFDDNANSPPFRYEAGGRPRFSANRPTGLESQRRDRSRTGAGLRESLAAVPGLHARSRCMA